MGVMSSPFSTSYTVPFAGVSSPGVRTVDSGLRCFAGLSDAETGLCLRLGRASPFMLEVVSVDDDGDVDVDVDVL
jgi:hypothetical protein